MFTPIPIDEWRKETELTVEETGWRQATHIVSLRDIVEVLHIEFMSKEYLKKLLRRVALIGDPECRVYSQCKIRFTEIDPHTLEIGQLFVERGKYRALIEEFTNLLSKRHCVKPGIAKLPPMRVLGRTADGTLGIAQYIPPIIENGSGIFRLLDGIHRNYIIRSTGGTIDAVLIEHVATPFPCKTRRWNKGIKIVDEKPPPDERFEDLNRALFRNLKLIGIDG